MMNVNAVADSAQVDGGKNESPPSPTGSGGPAIHGGSKVYMTGPLFLSSKGIGWTSWKKRWFILTQTSLVFYRSDPNAAPQKGGEVNLTLGGIDLNSSGSVVVKEDKKLLIVSFADGRDGRAFTLKAETLEELQKWKTALEEALANAPAGPVMGQSASKNEQSNSDDISSEQSKDKEPAKSTVLGRPILLALEDVDGTPSFLEKALRFVEEHGVKTEGILRQAADVELVERRILEYEKGKKEFSPNEDAHVIGDCIKYILRELPSSPVPASCCKALVEAHRTDRSIRVNAMQTAICETFPEPNRRLLQRILEMCIIVASNKTVNRMSVSAVAACMAPLLLRPLLAGECDIDTHIDMGGDSSVLLLQAAAAANHAQAIVITLLDEYDKIFGDGAGTHEPYSDSEESEYESDEITDEGSFDEDDEDYVTEGSDYDEEEDDQESRATDSDIGDNDEQVSQSGSSSGNSPRVRASREANQSSPDTGKVKSNYSSELTEDDPSEASLAQISAELSQGHSRGARRRSAWGRNPAKKNLSRESSEVSVDDEADGAKPDLLTGIPDEAMVKSFLGDILEKRKHDLRERRLYLEKDVMTLQRQLRKEKELRAVLEAGLKNSQLPLPMSLLMNEKMKAELEEITRTEADVMILKRKSDDLESQLYEQREHNFKVGHDRAKESLPMSSSSENLSTYSKDESYLDNQDKKTDSPSSLQSLQTDSAQNPRLLSVVAMASASALESGTNSKFGTVGSKKIGFKVEQGTNAGSALSKLTNRLNFLKERRTQIANELQNLNKGRPLNRPAENHPRSPENPNKYQESKAESSDKGQESETREQLQNPNPNPNSGQPPQHSLDRGKKSKKTPSLDKGKPENSGFSKFSPKTFSR